MVHHPYGVIVPRFAVNRLVVRRAQDDGGPHAEHVRILLGDRRSHRRHRVRLRDPRPTQVLPVCLEQVTPEIRAFELSGGVFVSIEQYLGLATIGERYGQRMNILRHDEVKVMILKRGGSLAYRFL